MPYETRPNTGSLFRNDRKEAETHPDHTGTLNVDGVNFYLNAWIKTAASGKKYFSLSLKRKDKQPETAPVALPAEPGLDGDVSF